MDLNEKLVKIGLKVKYLRIERGLSQTDLAYKIGKDQPSINRLERGRINPSILFLIEIAIGLDISVKDILDDF